MRILGAQLRARTMGLALTALLAAGCRPAEVPVASSQDLAALDRLLRLIEQRLALMHDVARWKWTAGKQIKDPQREQELLQDVVERGRARGLDPDLVRPFFEAQIAAACLVQQDDFDRWSREKQGPFAGTKSLAALRERINDLNGELIDALCEVRPLLDERPLQKALPGRAEKILVGDDQARVREIAISPLRRGSTAAIE